MTQPKIKQFHSTPGAVPYASIDTLRSYNKEQVAEYEAKFGEATFDEVVQLTIIREKIYDESALLAASNDVIVTRTQNELESQLFAPDKNSVQHTYPQPPEAIALTPRATPVRYDIQSINLDLGETRYFIADHAKLRGAWQWLVEDTAQIAAEHIAESKDKHVLTQLDTLDVNPVTATAPWTASSADPELDLSKAISNIVANSNISTAQLKKPNAFGVVIPAAAFTGVTRLKLIRNIIQPVQDFLQTEYKVSIILSRKPETESTWPIDKDAYVLPMMDRRIGFLSTWDGGGIIPAQEINRVAGRGDEFIIKQWYKFKGLPYPFSGTTNAKVVKITGVLS